MLSERRAVIVTGGAHGIGAAIVRHFAMHGDAVAIADVNSERGKALEDALRADGNSALFVRTDVADENSVRDMVSCVLSEWGRIDVLCNNAGIEIYRPAHEYSSVEWDRVLDINLRGAFLCAKYAFPALLRCHGAIVNIASVQAFASEPLLAAYAASKAGLLAFTRGMAIECARDGVRVNAVCPGAVHTGLMDAYLKSQSDPDAMLQSISKAIPMGRIGQAEDIAGVVWFLASPEASYVTGAFLAVDGGVLAKIAL
jgi:NAD(P)-dependent dehydrogenase (short-subunit alcohol dehydrogenase family)